VSDTIADSHRSAIGCSKIAQALGLSRFGSRFELWQMHTGRTEQADLSSELRVALGEPMEDVLRPFVEERLDRDLRRDHKVYRHTALPLIAHVDYRASKRDGERVRPVVDMKTSLGFGARHRFGEGEDAVDDDVLLQMQGYMLLTGAEVAYVAALTPGPELRTYTIESDRELHDMILDGLADYWRLVETDTPPDPANEQEARLRWATHTEGKALDADADMEALLRHYASVKRQLRELEKTERSIRDDLIPRLQDADQILLNGAKVATFRANKDRRFTDWEHLALSLLDRVSAVERGELLNLHTGTKPGARVLRLSKAIEDIA
jgi:predicted phage-related endonuclease